MVPDEGENFSVGAAFQPRFVRCFGIAAESRSHQWSDIAEGDGAMQESARLQIP
jgi:hypothetical protein